MPPRVPLLTSSQSRLVAYVLGKGACARRRSCYYPGYPLESGQYARPGMTCSAVLLPTGVRVSLACQCNPFPALRRRYCTTCHRSAARKLYRRHAALGVFHSVALRMHARCTFVLRACSSGANCSQYRTQQDDTAVPSSTASRHPSATIPNEPEHGP
jgi:hypothetical protein